MYKGRYFIRQRKYISGRYMEIMTYPVFQKAGIRRNKCRPTSEIQKRLNQKNREMRLARLIHTNFTEDDIALHLTYKIEPTEEAAQKEITNFLRRLKRKMAKQEIKLKYILTTEIGVKKKRVHHHLIINGGLGRDEIERLWHNGYANSKRLQFEDDGVTALARYMTKGGARYKAWSSSRNLKQPTMIEKDGEVTVSEMKEMANNIEKRNSHNFYEGQYPEFELVDAQCYKNNLNKGIYIYAMMRKKE